MNGDSILGSVKKLLGSDDYDQLKHINVSINLIDKYFKIMFPKKVVLKPIRPGDKK